MIDYLTRKPYPVCKSSKNGNPRIKEMLSNIDKDIFDATALEINTAANMGNAKLNFPVISNMMIEMLIVCVVPAVIATAPIMAYTPGESESARN